MKEITKRVPITISAISLAFATYGKIIVSYTNHYFYWVCAIISIFLLLLLLLKFIFNIDSVKENYNDILLIPLFTLIPMSITVINSYFYIYAHIATQIIWYIAFFLFIFNLFYCAVKIIKHKFVNKIYPSLFVNFIGINVLIFNRAGFVDGEFLRIIFYSTLVLYVFVFSLITYILLKLKHIDDFTKPFLSIYAAPGSLLTVSYVTINSNANDYFVYLLFCINTVGFIILCYTFVTTKIGVYKASLAAFTFPLVINTLATKSVAIYFGNGFIQYYLYFQIFLSLFILFYVLFMFMRHIFFHPLYILITQQNRS